MGIISPFIIILVTGALTHRPYFHTKCFEYILYFPNSHLLPLDWTAHLYTRNNLQQPFNLCICRSLERGRKFTWSQGKCANRSQNLDHWSFDALSLLAVPWGQISAGPLQEQCGDIFILSLTHTHTPVVQASRSHQHLLNTNKGWIIKFWLWPQPHPGNWQKKSTSIVQQHQHCIWARCTLDKLLV